jgi:hypothetical protein
MLCLCSPAVWNTLTGRSFYADLYDAPHRIIQLPEAAERKSAAATKGRWSPHPAYQILLLWAFWHLGL